MHPRLRAPLLLAAAFLLLAGPAAAADRTVEMRDILFAPSGVEVTVGDRVTWVNRDDVPHDAAGDGWATPLLDRDQSASIRFQAAGTYAYICTVHPTMTGQVVVRAAPADGGGGATQPPTDALPLPGTGGSGSGAGAGAPEVGWALVLVVVVGLAAPLALRPRRRDG